jgi:hypothetical protein
LSLISSFVFNLYSDIAPVFKTSILHGDKKSACNLLFTATLPQLAKPGTMTPKTAPNLAYPPGQILSIVSGLISKDSDTNAYFPF